MTASLRPIMTSNFLMDAPCKEQMASLCDSVRHVQPQQVLAQGQRGQAMPAWLSPMLEDWV
jgi:hypothetical protein